MLKIDEKVRLAVEIGATMSTDIVTELSGVAGLIKACYEQRRLPTGVHDMLQRRQKLITSKLDALIELLGAVAHSV